MDTEPITINPTCIKLLNDCKEYARLNYDILILGETGTGKDVIARYIHHHSHRNNRPFTPVSCTNLTADLFESSMFGHKAGAFTGALRKTKGLIEETNKGTLFLDEVGDAPWSIQAKLLRFLETKKFFMVGGTREISVDIRVLAATNHDLIYAVGDNYFREDLYYRLNAITIELPPLRERLEDIAPLTIHFLERASKERNQSFVITDAALELLRQYPFPGNIRELKNIVCRTTALNKTGQIDVEDLQFLLLNNGRICPEDELNSKVSHLTISSIKRALNKSHGNVQKAAGYLNMHRSNLHRKIKKHNISLDDFQNSQPFIAPR